MILRSVLEILAAHSELHVFDVEHAPCSIMLTLIDRAAHAPFYLS
jgi:hypothetical protein